eukprot:gnl/TRDRNA2_/TRDRNA2_196363_c0_seq1.p1 gnl/TRDRNA2_/TRDRNA2_196363_c0~~gnl/TRDRNA2_/TRDRNA2_196363_c0_seq1.p1  ORF type:complete len:271 (+),score=44.79 gnl/TRDRNA2_/TRDRNA2_196363_c0_seq1:51-863(+)
MTVLEAARCAVLLTLLAGVATVLLWCQGQYAYNLSEQQHVQEPAAAIATMMQPTRATRMQPTKFMQPTVSQPTGAIYPAWSSKQPSVKATAVAAQPSAREWIDAWKAKMAGGSSAAPVADSSTNIFEPAPDWFMKPLMKTLLSSLTSSEQRSKEFAAFRKLRHTDAAAYENDVSAMLDIVDSVADNPYAKHRFPFPLPSLRTKLGSLRRVIDLVAEGCTMESERKKAMLIVLGEVCQIRGGIRALESRATSNPEVVARMAKMIKLWQGPL